MSEGKVQTEEYQVSGDSLVAKVKELVHEGNIRGSGRANRGLLSAQLHQQCWVLLYVGRLTCPPLSCRP